MSQSPQTGQFNSYIQDNLIKELELNSKSQSPQTGQFNSYIQNPRSKFQECFVRVSIPSNGSIQFLLLGG